MKKETVIVHSGGMDSSLCLALAKEEYGAENILSISFSYGQRHSKELEFAEKICNDWKIDHRIINIDCLNKITESALLNKTEKIQGSDDSSPNTLVVHENILH